MKPDQCGYAAGGAGEGRVTEGGGERGRDPRRTLTNESVGSLNPGEHQVRIGRGSMIGAAAVTSALLMATAATPAIQSQQSEAASGIAALARMNWEVDVQHIEALLKLPGLQDNIKWQGPSSGYEAPMFGANYYATGSALGVTHISIQWQIGRFGRSSPVIFNSLSIEFAPGRCPSKDQLTLSIGVKPITGVMASPHGGASTNVTGFTISQPNGEEPVSVIYTGDNTCRIAISHNREL